MGIEAAAAKIEGTIIYSVVGRTHYGFDIYSVPVLSAAVSPGRVLDSHHLIETKLTDGVSVNFNGCFALDSVEKPAEDSLIYVSERTGSAKIYLKGSKEVSELEPVNGVAVNGSQAPDLFYDRPLLIGRKVYFVSTQEAAESLQQSWAAVYVTSLDTGHSVRLTPQGVVDLSPSLSPSGKWVSVASYGGRGWDGEIEDLHTDIWIFNAEDGSQRKLVAKNGGWPTWADERTIFFHRRAEDGWWSIYKVSIPEGEGGAVVEAERITPPCVHAFTPAASKTGDWLAVATRRPESSYRQVEIFYLESKEFEAVTKSLNPEKHHYNPFVSAATGRLGYHRCRDVGVREEGGEMPLAAPLVARLEPMICPAKGLGLVRIDGFFPSVSPCGRFIAFNHQLPGQSGMGLFVMKSDGSKTWNVSRESVFHNAWDPRRSGVVYTSVGRIFAPGSFSVQVAAIHFDLASLTDDVDSIHSDVELLTRPGTGNNAFPAPSPDGREIVFRSGRDGSKNLYIMDAIRGEEGGIRRLSNGNWTDTMPAWSPDGDWIAFSSSRASDDGTNLAIAKFALYMVRPDGKDLRRVLPKSDDQLGRINHVYFSPDSKSIVFTSDLGALSAEPISLPNQFQPYGEVFISRSDGSEIVRLTHNAYEDGTPIWTSAVIVPSPGSEPLRGDFGEPVWLSQISEEMQSACC